MAKGGVMGGDAAKDLVAMLGAALPAIVALWKQPFRWEVILLAAVIALLWWIIRGLREENRECRRLIRALQGTCAALYDAVHKAAERRDPQMPPLSELLSGRVTYEWQPPQASPWRRPRDRE